MLDGERVDALCMGSVLGGKSKVQVRRLQMRVFGFLGKFAAVY